VNQYEHQAIKKRVIKTYNLNDLVVFSTLVSGKVVLEAVSVGGDIATLGGFQVVGHARDVREEGSSGTNLDTHVAASARGRVDATAKVFDKGPGFTHDSEAPSNIEYDTCRKY
jgi:hypothetical protein